MQTIGILLPRSTYYETMGFELYEGLRSGLKQLGHEDIRIVSENIGFGADKQQCYRSAEKLLLEDNASVVIAYIGHRTAQLLRPLFLAANRMLIVLDAGANMPTEWPECPNILYHSLHNALGAWLAAKRAVADGCKTGGMVTGYYDGGYLHTMGIYSGFINAGGTITFNHATGYKAEEFSMLPLKEQLEKDPGFALLTIFSAEFAEWYFAAIRDLFGEENDLNIYLPPYMFEETMLEKAPYPGNNAKGIAAWSRSLDTAENKIFTETIRETGKALTLFTLLGWEGSRIISKVLELAAANKNNISQINAGLRSFEFTGPRGLVRVHPEKNTTISPMYNATIAKSENGTCRVEIGSVIADPIADFDEMSKLPLEGVTSSWFNSYVCI